MTKIYKSKKANQYEQIKFDFYVLYFFDIILNCIF